jgi:hypothetical protein
VPRCPHPSEPTFDLLYVGIAPANATSGQTIRTRAIGNHLGGNIAASTFRFSLASLLMETLSLHPQMTRKKVVLSRDENQALGVWQRTHLRSTWCEEADPWAIEAKVIAAMGPPLNLASNSAHPFYSTMRAARKRFRAAAV